MDEEKQQDGIMKKTGDALKKGAKKQAKNFAKKIIKKVIMAVATFILKIVIPIILAIVIITSIANFLEKIFSDSSKEANAFAVKYSSSSSGGGSNNSGGTGSSGEDEEESSLNSIIVDINSTTENGAYKLTYEFKDENGNPYSDDQALSNIKNDLLEENENLDLTKFSNSELKIIGALMYNGLMVEDCNEEELKALVIFLKADIASQSFDLRNGEDTDIDIETLRDNDEVYGTLELHKTTIETDENGNISYKEIKLEYVPYGDETTRRNFLLYGCTKG